MNNNKLTEKMRLDLKNLQSQVAEAALEIQKNIGLGLTASDYCRALARELKIRNIDYEREKMVTLPYKGEIAGEYMVDFAVDNRIILAVISSDEIEVSELAKQRSFLKALNYKVGMVINFANEKVEIKSVYR
jgi:GxxExxY protein